LAFADQPGRSRQYRRLVRRNRVVGVLRLAVPAAGAVLLAALLIQITLSSFGARYGIGTIEVNRDSVRVETPEYAGTLTDGSTYRIWAEEAQAAIENTDLIALTNARVLIERKDGLTREASAENAVLDTVTQQVQIADGTEIGESSGTTGHLTDSIFDWASQTLTARGPVEIDYSDGSTVRAEGMVHEANASRWTFTKATVTLPATPGEDQE
jgi:lipopolysaccharide export system protein LptC